MADDMSDAERRSLAEWAAKDGSPETPAAVAEEAASAAELAKREAIFAAGRETPRAEPEIAETTADSVNASVEAETPTVEMEAAAEPTAVAEPPKAKKVVQPLPKWMQDRLAEQTFQQREAERLAAEARGRAEVAEAELAELRKRAASGESPPAAAKDIPGPDFVPRTQVEARALEIAKMDAFNASADQAYFAGKAAYKEDFDAALQPLQAMGAMQRMDFQEAALATGAAHDVLFELGSDPNKASEILGLLKRGNVAKATAEMTRVADAVAARKAADAAATEAAKKGKKMPVSAVPAPIRAVGGSALPTIDLEKADDETFDREFSGVMKRLGWN